MRLGRQVGFPSSQKQNKAGLDCFKKIMEYIDPIMYREIVAGAGRSSSNYIDDENYDEDEDDDYEYSEDEDESVGIEDLASNCDP